VATEVTSERVTLEHVRAAGLSPSVVRRLFNKNGLNWPAFLADGIAVADLAAVNDALAERLIEKAINDAKPIHTTNRGVRVYHRHIRAADICMKGSREFFKKHSLDWQDFLANGIAVSTLEEIGDPIALRAAEKAIEEESNGRR
jgi:HEAT repeat protein